jgi:REP element-mobilizing transposase RayT
VGISAFRRATRSIERRDVDIICWKAWRARAETALNCPSVHFTGVQARAIGRGFANAIRNSGLTIWACSILPEHVHLVIARHTYKVEQICNLLKGAATKALKAESLHPLAKYRVRGKIPSPWAEKQWKVYLDSEEAIEQAIRYVEENPIKEGKPHQSWPFVTPFGGLPKSGWITYH